MNEKQKDAQDNLAEVRSLSEKSRKFLEFSLNNKLKLNFIAANSSSYVNKQRVIFTLQEMLYSQ